MSLKLLTVFSLITLLCQVVFSIYYSVNIVDQNILFNTNEVLLNQLTLKNQQLEIDLSIQNSLTRTLQFADNQSFIPVTSVINLE
jgi:hypothetical protein